MKKKHITDALEIIERTITRGDPKLHRRMEQDYLNLRVAQIIYDARTEAGLTQAQLAKKARTTQPVIARLENSDYRGHSLTMLQRIAEALERRVDIQLVAPSNERPPRRPAA